MTKRQMAAKLLAVFGVDGKNWVNHGNGSDGRVCLTQATVELDEADPILDEIKKRLKVSTLADIQDWNDCMKWPSIKKLLVSIRDGRKFNKKAAEALSAEPT